MLNVWDAFPFTVTRLPNQLIANGVGEGGYECRRGTEQNGLEVNFSRLFNIDQHDAGKNQCSQQNTFGGNLPVEKGQYDGCGENGHLPGSRDDPARRIRGAEGDTRIKNSKANSSREHPEHPMCAEDFPNLCERFFALCCQKDERKKNEHVSEAQAGCPRPMPACKTHAAVKDERTAKKK